MCYTIFMIYSPKKTQIGSRDIASIPGDKSISHRSVILGSLADNSSLFKGFLCAEDCVHTAEIFQQLGVEIDLDRSAKTIRIQGRGLRGLKQASGDLYVGNSGTGIRLISGALAGQSFDSKLLGDDSIQKRPMSRIITPLRLMGADINGVERDGKLYPPLSIKGKKSLQAIDYELPMPSAQVKSAILLASLYAEGQTRIHEPIACRNHSEVMLKAFGATISIEDKIISCDGSKALSNPFYKALQIPSDFSSAAFFIVLGLLIPGTELCLRHIGLNPTRAALIQVLQDMGADIEIINEAHDLEPYGDIVVRSSSLINITVDSSLIPIIIDEIPILAVAGMFASGTMRISEAEELRVKESDRIASIVKLVQAFGGSIQEFEDGFELESGIAPDKVFIQTFYDHRVAMSAIIAATVAGVDIELDNSDCIATSFPDFFNILSECFS